METSYKKEGLKSMQRLSALLCLLAAIIFFTQLRVLAVDSESGMIKGKIFDRTGAIITGAKVELLDAGMSEFRRAETDGDGQFIFEKLPAENYVVRIGKTGFKEATRGIKIFRNEQMSMEVKLDVAGLSDTVKDSARQKYRLLQSNGLLVESAYHQEEGELQHSFSFARSNRNNWTFNFNEEIPLGSEKHQLSFSLPAQLVNIEADGNRGFGDAKFEYSYLLYGSNTSRTTISPGFGLTIPTGDSRKELGAGAPGISLQVPVSVMLTERFASNSTFETTFTKSAKNTEGERADLTDFEIGQSFVWFAKPKLNFLIEAVWERSQEVGGDGLRKSEQEFFFSPGVRWAHTFKNGLTIIPGVGVPFGIGASSGERGIFFSLAFEHSLKKERE